MDGQVYLFVNGVPILDKEEYTLWSIRMRAYLPSLRYDVWNSVTSGYIPPKRIRTTYQKESKKKKSISMETILDELP